MEKNKNVTKNQHIVPQRHLRNFSIPTDNNKIKAFDCDQVRILNKDQTFAATTDCNRMNGVYTAKDGIISFGQFTSTKMYCEGSQETIFSELIRDTSGYHFTSKGELILDLKFDSGSVTFR